MHRVSQAGLSRRSFLLGTAAVGAGLTVGVYLNRRNNETVTALPGDTAGRVDLEWEPQAFVRIGTDNRVTVYCKHTEVGQGIYTGMATVVAEELDASWEQMHVESAPANVELYESLSWEGSQATGGSASLKYSFDQLRQVGAATREMLVNAAAGHWDVPATEITVTSGVIHHESSGNSLTFGDLAERAAAESVPETVKLKPTEEYRFSNEAVRRVDLEEKTNGTAQFTQDFTLPGMLIAVVAHPPRFGGALISYDSTEAKAARAAPSSFRGGLG